MLRVYRSSCFVVVCLHLRARVKPIGEENRGFRLLTKMGWKLGQGLGIKSDGITVPVVLKSQVATLGLGKGAEDDK